MKSGHGAGGCARAVARAPGLAAGAAEIVVSDLQDTVLSVAREMGATHTINVARDAAELESHGADKGHFDVAFECSAASAAEAFRVASDRSRSVKVHLSFAGS